jgi:PIN domain nuclease of toxin-antitoxin system
MASPMMVNSRSTVERILPTPHKAPFDRLLIAQAIEEQLTLVIVDPMMGLYPVAVLG